MAASGIKWLLPAGDFTGGAADANEIGYRMQGPGTVNRMQVRIRQGAGNGNPYNLTVFKNGIATGITMSRLSTDAGDFEVVASEPFVDGDRLSLQVQADSSLGSTPQDVQAFLRYQGSGGVVGIDPLENLFYVAKNGDDATGTGSIAEPFLTVQAAYDAIGHAADNAEWNDATKRFYRVIVAPGVYTGGVLLPVRPNVWTYLYGASIDGDVGLVFPTGLITSGIGSPQWGFRGDGRARCGMVPGLTLSTESRETFSGQWATARPLHSSPNCSW